MESPVKMDRTSDTTNAVMQLSNRFVRRTSIRMKMVLATVVSLLINTPIAAYLDNLIRSTYNVGGYGPLISSVVTLMVTTSFIVIAVHFIVLKPLKNVTEATLSVAAGDLHVTVSHRAQDEVGELVTAFNDMTSQLRVLVETVVTSSQQLSALSTELRDTADAGTAEMNQLTLHVSDIAQGATTQLQGAVESSRAMEELAHGIGRVAASAAAVGEASSQAEKQAEEGKRGIRNAIEQMSEIQQSVVEVSTSVKKLSVTSEQIGVIAQTMSQIAAQTNLLALNAAIEAARAGENGRGFAVVAAEVRKLASSAGSQAQEVGSLVSAVQEDIAASVQSMNTATEQVEDGRQKVDQAGVVFESIVQSFQEVIGQVQEVSAVSQQMSAGTEQVAASVEETAVIARESAGRLNELQEASGQQQSRMEDLLERASSLHHVGLTLSEAVSKFRV
jgi:methyl-accepting chemotaxis protein